MALEIARALAANERDDNLHIARILLLINACSGRKGIKPIEGLTKLAKLDFMLRYPTSLERALSAKDGAVGDAELDSFERTTVESKMIRFRYGPWDHRYRRWVALMAARGLVSVYVKGRTVNVQLTDLGRVVAGNLSQASALEKIDRRARIISREFGSSTGTALKDFVYETFPELTSMKWGQEISP